MPGSILVVTFDTATGIRTGRLVGSTLLEDQAVTSGKIASGIVGTVHLRDLNVTSAKLAGAIIGLLGSVADEAITSAKLASGAVVGDRIAYGALLSGHFGSGQIASGHLVSAVAGLLGTVADGGITSAKIASGAVGGVHIFSGSIPGLDLENQAITSSKINTLAVGTPHLAALAVTGAKVASGAITSGKVGINAIGGAKLWDFGLLSGKYASGSITEQALVSGISIDIAETTKEPGYRAAVIMSAYDPVYVAAISGNYVGIAIALSGTMPAIGIAAANIASGSLGDINYGGRAPAPASIVSGQYGRPVFVGASGTGLTITPPSTSGYCQQIMGVVKDDDEIMLYPEPGYIEIT